MEQDEAVARVNGREIGVRLLRMVLAQAREQFAKSGKAVTPEIEKEIQREAIDQLIGRELLFEESLRRRCFADEEEVERQVTDLAEQAGGMLALTVMLARRGLQLDEVRDGIRRDLAIDAVVDGEVVQDSEGVSVDQARAFFEANRASFRAQERSTVSHISIGLPKNAYTGAVARAHERLNTLRARIDSGESFDEVARTASAEEDGIQSGMLGPIERGTLARELEEMAFTLPLNELSSVFRSSLGVHIVRVLAREGARDMRFDEVAQAIAQHLGTRRRAELAEALTVALRRNAVIEILLEDC